MKIFVDADACPVVQIVEQTARQQEIPVMLLCDTNHVLTSDYSEVKVIGAGMDAVDFALISLCKKGDVVVTQDYGVAAMALGKGARAIHQSGKWYTDDNIDRMLMERHVSKKARRSSSKMHQKGPHKRTKEDDKQFQISFEKMLLFSQIDTSVDCEYKCNPQPSCEISVTGVVKKVITGKSRVVVTECATGKQLAFAPNVLQSCMNPEQVEIQTLEIADRGNDMIEIKTKYDSSRIAINGNIIRVYPWKANLKRVDCTHCENCGRCS